MAIPSARKKVVLESGKIEEKQPLRLQETDEKQSDTPPVSIWVSALPAISRLTRQRRYLSDWTRKEFTECNRVLTPACLKKGIVIIGIVILVLIGIVIFVLIDTISNCPLLKEEAAQKKDLALQWPLIRRCVLGPLPANRQRIIPRENDVPLNAWDVRVQRSQPGGNLGNRQPLDRAVNTLQSECDFWWLTTTNSETFLSGPSLHWYLRNHEEWFANQKLPAQASPCRLLMLQPHDLPAWGEDFPDNMDAETNFAHQYTDRFKGRYHAMIALHEIATGHSGFSGNIPNSGERKTLDRQRLSSLGVSEQPLFAAYTDFDVFFSNKSRSWSDLIDRIDRGVKRFAQGGSTMESRLCDSWSSVKKSAGHPFPCHHKDRFEEIRSRLRSAKDIALAIAMDDYAAGDGDHNWMTNSGVLLFQPASHTNRFIAEAALTIMPNFRLEHVFDYAEQGRLTYVLNQTFDLDMDVLTWASTYDEDDFNKVFGSTSGDVENDEILMLGLFDVNAALDHPLFRQAAEHWKKRVSTSASTSAPEAEEPMGVAIVFPRWMNAPACNRNWLDTRLGESRDARFFHCGDFLGHFNGCNKKRIYDKTVRRRIREQCKSSLDWPMTNDDGSPFDWNTWEAEADNDEIAEQANIL